MTTTKSASVRVRRAQRVVEIHRVSRRAVRPFELIGERYVELLPNPSRHLSAGCGEPFWRDPSLASEFPVGHS